MTQTYFYKNRNSETKHFSLLQCALAYPNSLFQFSSQRTIVGTRHKNYLHPNAITLTKKTQYKRLFKAYVPSKVVNLCRQKATPYPLLTLPPHMLH